MMTEKLMGGVPFTSRALYLSVYYKCF